MTAHVVALRVEVLVTVDEGGAESAIAIAREHVANDWILRTREGIDRRGAHYTIKGLSGEPTGAVAWMPNGRVVAPSAPLLQEPEASEEDEAPEEAPPAPPALPAKPAATIQLDIW